MRYSIHSVLSEQRCQAYTFLMADFSLTPFVTLSMIKAKRFGFNGFVDTVESMFEVYQKMAKIDMLLPMKVDSARPLM
jgi:hypothetical protein